MSRNAPASGGTDDPQRQSTTGDGSAWQQRIRGAATPALDQWGYGTALSAVRRRLRAIFGTSLLVVVVTLFFDPGGLTGLLLTVWVLLSLPIAAVTACLLVLLRDPAGAREVWWENGTLATVGLLSIAALARGSQTGPAGRAAWQLLFGSDPPVESDYRFETDESDVDLRAVARIRRYVRYAVVGSVALIVAEAVVRFGALEPLLAGTLGAEPGPIGWVLFAAGAAVLGGVIGAIGAVTAR